MEASGIVKGVSGLAGMIPMVGPAISMVGGVVGGVLEKNEAQKQAEQAEKVRKDALKLKPDNLSPEFQQRLRADKMAELAGLPGKNLWQNMIDQRTANDMRSIQDSAPNGAAALAAASAAMGRNAQDVNTLAIKDSEFRNDASNQTRDTLWNVGLQKDEEKAIRDLKQTQGLSAAAALENAATFNNVNANNKIIGSIGSTASSISANVDAKNKDALWMEFMSKYFGNNTSSTIGFPTYDAPAQNPNFNYTPGTEGMGGTELAGNFNSNPLWGTI